MRTNVISAGLAAALLMAALPVTTAWATTRAEAEQAIAEAEEARKKAASAGGEWRDTAKMIQQATGLLDTREYTKALGIAEKAKLQGELGYEQAMGEREAGFPEYMVAMVDKKPAVAEMEIGEMGLKPLEVTHAGEKVVIERTHDEGATLPAEFLKTDRNCPPFCIQPMSAGEGVETIGEIEMLEYLQQASEGGAALVIDSRTPDWVMRGTIPGSTNIPWDQIDPQQQGMFGDRGDDYVRTLMTERFGVKEGDDGELDFIEAKTLVLFCNGIWCGQSTSNIGTLVQMGYPAEKLKWYRGGMQDWVSAGLTTVK